MTYSEFGGRVAENASHGTDHGTAAPHLFMGGWVNGGLYGTASSLTDLRESDLKQTVDFRSLYARVIEKRWGGSGVPTGLGRSPLLDVLTRDAGLDFTRESSYPGALGQGGGLMGKQRLGGIRTVVAAAFVLCVGVWVNLTVPVQAEMVGASDVPPSSQAPASRTPVLEQTPASVEPSLPLLLAEGANSCEIVSCGMGIKQTCQITCPADKTPKCSCDCERSIGPMCMDYKANCRCE